MMVAESRLYLYAVVDSPSRPLPDRSGLYGSKLESLAYRQIAVVASRLSVPNVAPEADNVWSHERVVEALMNERAVLPVRFGTTIAHEGLVMRALAAQYECFVERLRHVCGRVELALRVLGPAEAICCTPSPEEGPMVAEGLSAAPNGRAYLLARLQEEHQRQAQQRERQKLVEQVYRPLAELAADSVQQVSLTPQLLLLAAYLVDVERTADFCAMVGRLAQARPELGFLSTGPWPAYSFACIGLQMGDWE